MTVKTPQQKNALFDTLVQQLHQTGIFKTYDTPKGTPRAWDSSFKNSHIDERKNIPGTVWHIGDEPHNDLTTRQLQYYKDIIPTQDDIAAKTSTVRKAIMAYMPEEAFAAYLAYFRDTLDMPEHQAAIKQSIRQLDMQLLQRSLSEPVKWLDDAMRSGKHQSALLSTLAESATGKNIRNHPTLASALVIYHAAHSAYCKELGAAIDRSTEISDDERDNARYTLDSTSFNQFNHFLLFVSMGPLTLYHYAASTPRHSGLAASLSAILNPNHETTDHTRMSKAITAAWDSFFERKLTRREYRAGDALPPEADQKSEKIISCPAHHHLQMTARESLLESTYNFILVNPKKCASTKALVEAACNQASGRGR